MYELIECMLSISPGFTPYNRSCCVVYPVATASHILAIRLHVTLLEVGCKPMHVLDKVKQNKILTNKIQNNS